MNHVYWISPLLAGRCGPVAHPWDLDKLYNQGFRVIVSLDDTIDEEEITKKGFTHIQLYLPDVVLNSPERTELFVKKAHAFVNLMASQSQPVLVHCWAGNDRTGGMIACYLISCGVEPESAVAMVREVNPRAMSTPGYEDAVYLYAEEKTTQKDK
jgi:protein tyrosine/serine phosphatase